jgi:YjbE family integral membrane protein
MNLETFTDIGQIIFADIILSGDNALVIGMAAAGLAPKLRKRAIMMGMALAAGLRILFAIGATYLLAIKGVLLVGGLLLTWVCWRFYNDLREFNKAEQQAENGISEDQGDDKNFGRALFTILLADVSMSIDNIVAVAAIARDNTQLLIFGLALAIALMAFFASAIMKIMLRFRWLSYLGLVFLAYLAGVMLYDGAIELRLFGTSHSEVGE